jgi:hypothetical protein
VDVAAHELESAAFLITLSAAPFGNTEPSEGKEGRVKSEERIRRKAEGPQHSFFNTNLEKPVIVSYPGDLSTHRSCNDFHG